MGLCGLLSKGCVLIWLLLAVVSVGMVCVMKSSESLEQEHLLAAGVLCMCGQTGSAATAPDKSALQAHSCVVLGFFFCRAESRNKYYSC